MRQVVDSTQISGLPGQLTQRSQRHEFFKPNAVHKPIFFDGQNIYTPASKVMITSNCIKLTYQDNIDGTFQTQHNISEDIEEIRWNQYRLSLWLVGVAVISRRGADPGLRQVFSPSPRRSHQRRRGPWFRLGA